MITWAHEHAELRQVSGLYLHIPFCRKACVYCDFHFSTSMGARARVLGAMQRELRERVPEANGPFGTVYFGGGTPSLLTTEELRAFLDIAQAQGIASGAEVTLEANPDDITQERLLEWRAAGITRISLGTQSFRDDRLKWMGRAHDAQQALRSLGLIAKAGFTSWTIDLIYGLPGMTIAEWDEQLRIALDHGLPHLSAYCLTIEERTALHKQVAKGLVRPAHDEEQAAQFEHAIARMEAAGVEQYEISNFGRPGHFAQHNSNYWKGVPYLGIGPSAHSFDGSRRRWNVANNLRYADAIERGDEYWEEEVLTPAQRMNERILTGLRTTWGVDLRALGGELSTAQAEIAAQYVRSGDLLIQEERLLLTRKGRNFADRIASDLFLTE
ncbi:MAG: radical SAM family heme chaperone HemW [Flavobacteriales bacterium]